MKAKGKWKRLPAACQHAPAARCRCAPKTHGEAASWAPREGTRPTAWAKPWAPPEDWTDPHTHCRFEVQPERFRLPVPSEVMGGPQGVVHAQPWERGRPRPPPRPRFSRSARATIPTERSPLLTVLFSRQPHRTLPHPTRTLPPSRAVRSYGWSRRRPVRSTLGARPSPAATRAAFLPVSPSNHPNQKITPLCGLVLEASPVAV